MKTIGICMLAALVSFPAAGSELTPWILALRNVGPNAAGHRQAAAAWKELVRADAARLTEILAGFDDANPLAANWLRTAVDAIAQRQLQRGAALPVADLEAFIRDLRHNPRARRLAYEWLLRVDSTAPDRLLPGMLDDPSLQLRRDAVDRILSAADAQNQKGQSAQAIAAFRQSLYAARDRDQVDRAAAQLRKLGQTVDLNEVYGYLTQWKLIGPFDNTDGAGFNAVYPPEKELRADASYAGKHKAVGWIDYRTAGDDGRVDLNKPLGEEKSVTGYAWAVFTTDRPRDAMLRITSDNALKVFVNGALVGRFQSYHGGTQPDQYLVPVTLKSGRNEILVKVCQNDLVQEWTRSWDFTLRVTDAIGSPLLRPAVSLNAGRSEKVVAAVVLAAIGLLASPGMDSTQADDWQQFRGTLNQSVASPLSFPTQLRAEKHVAWKVSLPGRGPSSPIVVGNRVIVTAASGPRRDRLHVLAFDTATGKLLWERQLWATGHCVTNPFGGVAAPTPASDGQHIIAFFSSNDLACFDLEGNLLWLRGLAHERPDTRNDSGMASSPLIVQDTVVVQMETQAESWAAGLNVVAGETQWQLPREQIPTWTSPTLLPGKTPDQDAVLLQSRSCLTAHDPRSGKEIWRYTASCSTLSSPTVAEAVVFLPAGGIAALRVAGQPPEPKVLWQEARLGIENVSPIVHEGRLYIIRSPSILVASDATNGKMLWQLRLKGPIWATPVVAGNRLYAVNHDGLVQVVRLGTTGSLVGSLALEGGILASPAVAGGAIYFRSHEALWKLAPQAGDKADD